LSLFKKIYPYVNLNFNNLGIFQSLKLRILVEKILPIFFQLNFSRKYIGLLWVYTREPKTHGNQPDTF